MITEIPKIFESKNTIFHYTKSQTAIELILYNGELRLSPRKKSNDPIEKFHPAISESIWITDENIEDRTQEESEIILSGIETSFKDFRQVCFCMNDIRKNYQMNPKPYEYYGFLKPRMWDQYGIITRVSA